MKNKILLFVIIFCIGFKLNTKNIVDGIEKNILITAHRGISIYSDENTISSIKKAVEEDVDYVEIDLRSTKDNKIILCHDANLQKQFGINKDVKNLELKEIKEITNGKVPELEEVFKLFNKKVKFNLELKISDKNDNIGKTVISLINKYDLKDYVLITSFNKEVIIDIKNRNPQIKVGYISSNVDENFSDLNVDCLSLKYELINDELVEYIHSYSKEVHVWTVNDENLMNEMINSNVDNIITDDVTLLKKTLDKKIP